MLLKIRSLNAWTNNVGNPHPQMRPSDHMYPQKDRHGSVAAQAIQGIEATMAALPQALAKAMNPDSPISRRKVLSELAKEDWLLPEQKVALSVLFCKDTALCDQYQAWASDRNLRQIWLKTLLAMAPTVGTPASPVFV